MNIDERPAGPVELAPSGWRFPAAASDRVDDEVFVGADLLPATLLDAYKAGLFPMPLGGADLAAEGNGDDDSESSGQIGWWSPNPRGILRPQALRVSRSLRRSMRRYTVTIDRDFAEVIDACRLLPREGGWISPAIRDAYLRLYELGWAHSIEVRRPEGDLVGGLYGVGLHGLFAGESMFSLATDASKVALVKLVELLDGADGVLIDVQWCTPHLASLGAEPISRSGYKSLLDRALTLPGHHIFEVLRVAGYSS